MKGRPIYLFLLACITGFYFLASCSNSVTDDPPPIPDPEPEIPDVATCLESGTDADINALLTGEGAKVELCAGAVFEISNRIAINAKGQEIYTQGKPTDGTRAVLRLVSTGESTAVMMRDFDNAVLSHVIVDGNRPELGYGGGDALIYAGGSSFGQIIRNVDIIEPRSWSALQIIQGHPAPEPPCRGAIVENNVIGPAGRYDGTWSDGISLACRSSIVRNNTITDTTDGGIVIFDSPGSLIEGNLIRAVTQPMLGGINMVDYGPYEGDYTDTIVSDNIIEAAGDVIRIGIGMGVRVWVCVERDFGLTLKGAIVKNNILRGDYFQYGFIVDGVENWTVTGNISEATHSGVPAHDCYGTVASPPAAFMIHSARAEGTFQPEFEEADIELALWAIVDPVPGE
ncbi:MAG: right-handed parallel beta-helix repeat-containing protein [Balneolaceae bacterium]|nr:MAG: right-handed parallel beta-helix repeat-containing protein [Balneolaceae bacterium]